MLLRNGLLLSSLAVFLQIAVFLQPLLPKQYQIAPVCETISQVLIQTDFYNKHQHSTHHQHTSHESFVHAMQVNHANLGHDHHDPNHQCQYCTVYGNLVLPPELEVKQVLDRIQVRLLAFQQTFSHVWFVLQRLFLIPQGRAPPIFA
ncbi:MULTISPECIES: DUF2946 family protein [unclassified Acinetobacter]|uniref:DUF2946 family protein n=1 Tax=unclassified Acinetobacter TaxID=196816 RepID=UPI0025775FE4|nr:MULTISPECIES: DUF2946 family protein [unclassified Acinetobacter]MDM1758666.1 DUF2946 domain-containing protein [Acinetobacter sp. 256-1]MDM1761800.1 DUF2946 domain-containing protein [Acinetobacter sp. 251-1]